MQVHKGMLMADSMIKDREGRDSGEIETCEIIETTIEDLSLLALAFRTISLALEDETTATAGSEDFIQ